MSRSSEQPLRLPELHEIELLRVKAQALLDEATELARQADALELRLIRKSADDRFPTSRIARDVFELNQVFKLLFNREGISMARIVKFRRWLRTGELAA